MSVVMHTWLINTKGRILIDILLWSYTSIKWVYFILEKFVIDQIGY